MTSRARLLIGAIAAVVLVAAAGAVAARWVPAVPLGAGATLRATVTLSGTPGPDLPDNVDPSTVAASPAAQACLERIDQDQGQLDLCWNARRNMQDGDPSRDYYVPEVSGTLGPGTGPAPRWAVVRSRLSRAPSGDVFEGWPLDRYDGECASMEVTGLPVPQPGPLYGDLCGQTVGDVDQVNWVQTVTWRCVGCLIPDDRDRALTMYQAVAVPEGAWPAWEVYADIGS
jgi:hypothetical protein